MRVMLTLPTENTDMCFLAASSRGLSRRPGTLRYRARIIEVAGTSPATTREGAAMDLGIRNRRAIVTGGGSGIGYEAARQFLEEGVRVMICGRSEAKLNMARDALANTTAGEIHAVQADMSKEADIARLIDAAKARLGGVDILAHNAGTMHSGRFAALTDEPLRLQLDTNLFVLVR